MSWPELFCSALMYYTSSFILHEFVFDKRWRLWTLADRRLVDSLLKTVSRFKVKSYASFILAFFVKDSTIEKFAGKISIL